MSVKEKIYFEIDNLAQRELVLLYEQIKLMKRVKTLNRTDETSLTIEELHRHTSSSKTSWADDVSSSREDRI